MSLFRSIIMLDLDQFEALSQDMTLSKEASNPKGLNSNW